MPEYLSGRPLPAVSLQKAESNKLGHSFEEMLRLINNQYLKNHPNPRKATRVLKWVHNHKKLVNLGFQRIGETPICSAAAGTKHTFFLCASCSIEQWFWGLTPSKFYLRLGINEWPLCISPQRIPCTGQEGLEADCTGLAHTAETPRSTGWERGPIFAAVEQQQKAGCKIQLRLFSSGFNLTLC